MQNNSPTDETEVNRRSLLRRAALTGTATVALSSLGAQSVTAKERELARVEYDSPQLARSAIEEYGPDVLDELVDRGLIETASVASLPVETFGEYGAGETEGMKVFGKGGPADLSSDQISVIKEVGGSTVRINVRPDAGHAHAVIKTGESAELVDPANDLEPARRCSTSTDCGCTDCSAGGYEGVEKECCYSGGFLSDCDILDSGCICYTCG